MSARTEGGGWRSLLTDRAGWTSDRCQRLHQRLRAYILHLSVSYLPHPRALIGHLTHPPQKRQSPCLPRICLHCTL